MALKATLKVTVPFGGMTVPFAGAPERLKLAAFVPSRVTLFRVSEVTPVFVTVNDFEPGPV